MTKYGTKQLVEMHSALHNLVNSSEDLLPASSGGLVSQVKRRQCVYSAGLLPRLNIHRDMIPSVSVSVPLSLSPSQARLCSHALSDPHRPRGVPSICLKENRFKQQYQEDTRCNIV